MVGDELAITVKIADIGISGQRALVYMSHLTYTSKAMRKTKKERLKSAGWKIGDTTEFLDLTPEEESLIEIRLALSKHLRQRRSRKRLTQNQLAKAIESSQSRVAKMEAGDPSVSVDLLIRALLALGVNRKQMGRAIGASITA